MGFVSRSALVIMRLAYISSAQIGNIWEISRGYINKGIKKDSGKQRGKFYLEFILRFCGDLCVTLASATMLWEVLLATPL